MSFHEKEMNCVSNTFLYKVKSDTVLALHKYQEGKVIIA